MTSDVPEALVGVLVAVALLPPLVASGLLFGSGHWLVGTGAILLFFVNVVCINLSGVATFFAQGIRPKRWWEAQKASKAVKIAVALWVVLLALLAVLIYDICRTAPESRLLTRLPPPPGHHWAGPSRTAQG